MKKDIRRMHIVLSKEQDRQLTELMELFGENAKVVIGRALEMLYQEKFKK